MSTIPYWKYQITLLETELGEIAECLTELREKDDTFKSYRENKINMLKNEQGYINMEIDRLKKRIAFDEKVSPVITSKFVTHEPTEKEMKEREERYSAEDKMEGEHRTGASSNFFRGEYETIMKTELETDYRSM